MIFINATPMLYFDNHGLQKQNISLVHNSVGKAENKHEEQRNPTIAWYHQQTNIDPLKSYDMQPQHLASCKPIIYA